MSRNDRLLLFAIFTCYAIISLLLFNTLNDINIALLGCSALFLICLTQIYVLYRNELRHLDIDKKRDNDYKQMEAIISLISCISPIAPMPQMRGTAISPDFANVLVATIQKVKPKIILECGSGVSTIISSYCLKSYCEGHLYSLDHEIKYAKMTESNLKCHELTDYATVIHAPLKRHEINGNEWLWYDISQINNIDHIDILVIDGPTRMGDLKVRYPALPLLKNKLSDNATILIDDAGRSTEIKTTNEWLNEYKGIGNEWHDTEKGTTVLKFGKNYTCPCCNNKFHSFIPLPDRWRQPVEIRSRKFFNHDFDCEGEQELNWTCPFCRSNPRTRLYYQYIEKELFRTANSINILHIAPENQLGYLIKSHGTVNYTTMDLLRNDVDDKCDIRDMKCYDNNSFDFFICSHVLEHLPNKDNKALAELYRVTKQEGSGILSVPILEELEHTYENPSDNTPQKRKIAYGDETHYRIYSKSNLISNLTSVGFQVKQIYSDKLCSPEEMRKYGISKNTFFFLLEKSNRK